MDNNNTVDFSKLRDFIKDNYEYNRLKKKRRKKIIIILINILTISLLVGGGIGIKSIYDYKKDLKDAEKVQKELSTYSNKFEELKENNDVLQEKIINPEITKLFEELTKENNESVAWLKVKGTEIDTAIVQTNDNKFYLSHDFNKKYNSLGWAFADYRNSFPNLSKNTIIYGHTYKKTLVFSTLSNVLSKSFLDNADNHIIEFTTNEEKLYFKIFSIYTIKKTDDYLQVDFSKKGFEDFVNLLKSRSIRDFDEEVTSDDKILTLSTCYNTSNYRLVVHAKLLSNDEVNNEKNI